MFKDTPRGELIIGKQKYQSLTRLNNLGIAFASVQGNATQQPNAENFFIYTDGVMQVYAVFRGEGPYAVETCDNVAFLAGKLLLESPLTLVD